MIGPDVAAGREFPGAGHGLDQRAGDERAALGGEVHMFNKILAITGETGIEFVQHRIGVDKRHATLPVGGGEVEKQGLEAAIEAETVKIQIAGAAIERPGGGEVATAFAISGEPVHLPGRGELSKVAGAGETKGLFIRNDFRRGFHWRPVVQVNGGRRQHHGNPAHGGVMQHGAEIFAGMMHHGVERRIIEGDAGLLEFGQAAPGGSGMVALNKLRDAAQQDGGACALRPKMRTDKRKRGAMATEHGGGTKGADHFVVTGIDHQHIRFHAQRFVNKEPEDVGVDAGHGQAGHAGRGGRMCSLPESIRHAGQIKDGQRKSVRGRLANQHYAFFAGLFFHGYPDL